MMPSSATMRTDGATAAPPPPVSPHASTLTAALAQSDDLHFTHMLDLAQLVSAQENGQQAVTNTLPLDPSHIALRSGQPDEALIGGFTTEWDIPDSSTEPQFSQAEPDYTRFEDWIPQLARPSVPCDHCRSSGLSCYFLTNETPCIPCKTLFRDCSLSRAADENGAPSPRRLTADNLEAVEENLPEGSIAVARPGRSKSKGSSSRSSMSFQDDVPGTNKCSGIRFPRWAVKILRDWLDEHAAHPYPTEAQKVALERSTELTSGQIGNWLANARRRRKVTNKRRPKLMSSPSLKPTTPPIDIPNGGGEKPWDELSPLDRWRNSPPEHEPASINDIAVAVASNHLPSKVTRRTPAVARKGSSHGSGMSNHRAPSSGSVDTGQHSACSASTCISSRSHGSLNSFASSLMGKKEGRRRRRRTVPVNANLTDKGGRRIYQCTFCTDSFKSKYDWSRHEKSLHLSLETYVCTPDGPIITDTITGGKKCAYCDEPNPDSDHLDSHNHRQCKEKGIESRRFHRKDHLRQHLRLMHNCEITSSMDSWRSVATEITSRCGFCAERFRLWQERVNHLTAHFRAGAQMRDWRGCRGLEPIVAAQVMNAMPPYLIGIDSISPIPFSASSRAGPRGRKDLSKEYEQPPTAHESSSPPLDESNSDDYASKATSWEILTVRLGSYANVMAKKGITLTDEMLQCQARIILYGSEDDWNQTAADNPQWLDLFKKAHGLDYIPSTIGGSGTAVPEDLETYCDLGLRIPFSVQLKALNAKEAKQNAAAVERLAATKSAAAQSALGPESDFATTNYLRHHQYDIPADAAEHFATTTGPWPESGAMPPPPSPMPIEMMDFLDNHPGSIPGQFLSSPDATSTPLSPPQTSHTDISSPDSANYSDYHHQTPGNQPPFFSNWTLPASADEQAKMWDELERIIAETSGEAPSMEGFGAAVASPAAAFPIEGYMAGAGAKAVSPPSGQPSSSHPSFAEMLNEEMMQMDLAMGMGLDAHGFQASGTYFPPHSLPQHLSGGDNVPVQPNLDEMDFEGMFDLNGFDDGAFGTGTM